MAVENKEMEINVGKQDLLRVLAASQGVVQRKTTIPILSNFLLEAEDDKLTVTATDLDQTVQTSCAAKIKSPGACTVPARKLYEYIKLLPDGEITVRQMENHWVQFRMGRSNTKMAGLSRANFPEVPKFPEASTVRLPVAVLRSMISKTIFAIADEESRYTLNGALLVIKAGGLVMVATDGHRLAHVEKTGETFPVSGEKRSLIPQRAMNELLSLLANTEEEFLDHADDEQNLYFRIGDTLLTTRKLTGQFPNYEAVLPRDNDKFVIVRTQELLGCIQRVAQFADERSGAIVLRLEQNELKMSSSSTDTGESEETLETPYSSAPLAISFNSSYMVDFLKAVGHASEVRLEFKDAQAAGQMRPEDSGDEYKYRYVLMPMRM